MITINQVKICNRRILNRLLRTLSRAGTICVVAVFFCMTECSQNDVERFDSTRQEKLNTDLQKYMERVSTDTVFKAVKQGYATEKQQQIYEKIRFIASINTEFINGEFVFLAEDEFLEIPLVL